MIFPTAQRTPSSQSTASRPVVPLTHESDTPDGKQPKGLSFLHDTSAVQRILRVAQAHGYGDRTTALLFEGRLPDKPEGRDAFASWILLLDEPALNVAMLKLGNLAINTGCVATAEALLKAVKLEPAASFPNVALNLKLIETGLVEAMLPPLIDLLSFNKSFGTLTSPPPSALTGCRLRGKGGDSSSETTMPGRENVRGSVDVTVVCRSAFAASPLFCRISDPTSKTFQAFRASALFTAATGLG